MQKWMLSSSCSKQEIPFSRRHKICIFKDSWAHPCISVFLSTSTFTSIFLLLVVLMLEWILCVVNSIIYSLFFLFPCAKTSDFDRNTNIYNDLWCDVDKKMAHYYYYCSLPPTVRCKYSSEIATQSMNTRINNNQKSKNECRSIAHCSLFNVQLFTLTASVCAWAL